MSAYKVGVAGGVQVNVTPTAEGATLVIDEAGGKSHEILIGEGETKHAGVLRAWMTGRGADRVLYLRDAMGTTHKLPLAPLSEILSDAAAFQAGNAHQKLLALAAQWKAQVDQLPSPFTREPFSGPKLEVFEDPKLVPRELIVPSGVKRDHAQRSDNIAVLTKLLAAKGVPSEEVAKAYDTMVDSVAASLLGSHPQRATRTTFASFTAAGKIWLDLGCDRDKLAAASDATATLEGDHLRIRTRYGLDETYTTRVDGAQIMVDGPDGWRPLDRVLSEVFGYELSVGTQQMLSAMETGGQAYLGADHKVVVSKNAQAGAFTVAPNAREREMRMRHGQLVGMFTNPHESEGAPGVGLFTYHSHPATDDLTPPVPSALPLTVGFMCRGDRNEELHERWAIPFDEGPYYSQTTPSGADLVSFSEFARQYGWAMPHLIWYRSGQSEISALVFRPELNGEVYETSSKHIAELKLTF